MALPSKVSLALVAAGSLALVPWISAAQNITIDGRFSPAQTLVGPNYAITANLGKQVGSNLFHSFGQFGLATGESAAFSGPATISNVIGRVTGGNPSSIDGGIRSAITGANLYLINPSGIVFGPNATVNVSGSFHASTADYLKLSDGAKFQATNPDGSTLSAAPPAAFGFLTARPAAITVNGSSLGPVPGTLGLVAGPISMTGPPPKGAACAATLCAPAGTIHVTSVAGTGEVPVDPRNTAASTVTSFGQVNIKGGSTLDVSDPTNLGSGGSVFIHAGALTIDASEINGDNYGSGSGGVLSLRGDNQITLSNGAYAHSVAMASGNGADVLLSTASSGNVLIDNGTVTAGSAASGIGGSVSVTGGALTIVNLGVITSESDADGAGGPITIDAGAILVDGSAATFLPTGILSTAVGAGKAGDVAVTSSGTLTIRTNGTLGSVNFGSGDAGSVLVKVADALSIDGTNANPNLFIGTGISSLAFGNNGVGNNGSGGEIQVDAGSLAIANGGVISASTLFGSSGNAGNVMIHAGTLSIASSGLISSDTSGSGNGGTISVSVGRRFSIDGSNSSSLTGIFSDARVPNALNVGSRLILTGGIPGNIRVTTGALTIVNGGVISASTSGPSNGGEVAVSVAGALSIDGIGTNPALQTGIVSQANSGSTGNGGRVVVSSGSLSVVDNGEISSNTLARGAGGSVFVSTGTLSITNNGLISGGTFGPGNGGSVSVAVAGQLTIDGASGNPALATGITSQSFPGSTGNAGSVTVSAGTLSIANNGAISGATFGPGNGGSVSVAVAGQLTIDGASGSPAVVTGITSESLAGTGNGGNLTIAAGNLSIADNGTINSGTFGPGNGGSVLVAIAGQSSIAGGAAINAVSGGGSGSGGNVNVTSSSLTIRDGGVISTETFGPGSGGNIFVTVPGQLVVDANAGTKATGILATARPGSTGTGGNVTLNAGTISILNSGVISTERFGSGHTGSISVNVAQDLSINGSSAAGITGISARSEPGSVGSAGNVMVSADSLSITGGQISASTQGSGTGGDVGLVVGGTTTLTGGAQISAGTAGPGAGGSVELSTEGPLTLADRGTGITASSSSASSGGAGSVAVTASRVTITAGAEIASTTAGTGPGGSVVVTTPGALVLNGAGVTSTQIAASATGSQSGAGGSVMIKAESLTVEGGAQIGSSTGGSGKGGDVNVIVASDIVLPDRGPQITAQSTGSGDAGSITVSAGRLLMSNGAAISTEAVGERSAASGGNMTLHLRDFLYLVSSEISTSVKGDTGNGGNIAIDPQLVILEHSRIKADAIAGHGGNITITAGQFIPSSDSSVEATSELGISGTIVINGPRVDVNGALVVLSTQLRGRVEVLREACAARNGQPISSLIEPGRGGLPQDPETTLPALYTAGRDVALTPQSEEELVEARAPLHTTVRLTMRCG